MMRAARKLQLRWKRIKAEKEKEKAAMRLQANFR